MDYVIHTPLVEYYYDYIVGIVRNYDYKELCDMNFKEDIHTLGVFGNIDIYQHDDSSSVQSYQQKQYSDFDNESDISYNFQCNNPDMSSVVLKTKTMRLKVIQPIPDTKDTTQNSPAQKSLILSNRNSGLFEMGSSFNKKQQNQFFNSAQIGGSYQQHKSNGLENIVQKHGQSQLIIKNNEEEEEEEEEEEQKTSHQFENQKEPSGKTIKQLNIDTFYYNKNNNTSQTQRELSDNRIYIDSNQIQDCMPNKSSQNQQFIKQSGTSPTLISKQRRRKNRHSTQINNDSIEIEFKDVNPK